MMVWLAKQAAWSQARELEISTASFGLSANAIIVPGEEVDNKLSQVDSRKLAYMPAPSLTFSMWYHGRYLQITRNQERTGRRRRKEETLQISIFARHHRVLGELLLEAKRAYKAAEAQSVSIYAADTVNKSWSHVASRPKRNINSVILDPGVSRLLIDDAREFLESKAWYAARGIPFRRGWLLYGAPGSGKTSIITSIAGDLGLDIYIMSLSRAGLDDSTLTELITELPEKCLALIEDIDAAFTQSLNRDGPADADEKSPPGAPHEPPSSRLSLSGLLNAIDGVAAQEGRLLYATTNKYHALDPALCRPGRMDVHVEFKLASRYQAEKLFYSFYLPAGEETGDSDELSSTADDTKKESETASASDKVTFVGTSHRLRGPKLRSAEVAELAASFAAGIPEREVSMAALQGFLMGFKIRPHEAVVAVKDWVQSERETRLKQASHPV
ncbi:P-loop containing nucleoside triphosphate hydrolase protein [Mycena albidolilacea]|uniref:P-loop containing nucleoside triphosphate hydrolase protein n=1 Tax=Mycena albidolilacea TaxID=1033008 RepID=A0AAD6ZNW3_9AGAR|nr:P-loop containing nucleoside triphosphate hydrolase protein [Mycena albidolilacea]